ncbi:MAG: DUF2892 domain-containing protein [Flavobacteriaceae bacterium]|nr:DUF2892 domain-containing protein [Muriicola sp.]MBT8289584.1 DUF2892 domain-containing protein [Muriicola sp.]NNK09926.1 DUF2892 domain-containing protein [Flavobacteriaceae bacterium]NNK34777.1 DUF2892 domain-containing protein [Eudoraea sp.]NNL39927.1 DUF2892 domain-containing protein [Flavobacteriaceae bacterium]
MLLSVIVSIIAGAICLLFAVLYSKNSSLRITLGIIGVVLLFYGGFGYGSMNPLAVIETFDTGNKLKVEYPVKNVQVISPVEGDSVSCRILTMGVYPETHNKDIWVLLKPSDNKFYPQSDYTNTSYKENGKWQVVTRFGGDQGEAYELYVYETNAAASQVFSETIAKWKENDDYVGLQPEELPSGAQEIDRIQVNLARNCRGIH